jgi:allophanate hydrolase
MPRIPSLLIRDLQTGYSRGTFTPSDVARAIAARIEAAPDRRAWISRVSPDGLLERARSLEARGPAGLPLYGVPFAIKDNIDLAGTPTTAACPEYAYQPARSAPVVERLLAAGAIAVGKTNLDQFATGLVGVRSPYGACRNAFDPAFISGGSSSGSAIAVATGAVSFSLGTDTAGSGRVPAAFGNLVGLKPTRGRLSTRGVVAACASLDCVSIFALTAADAARVLAVAEGFDPDDPFSRPAPARAPAFGPAARLGVPRPSQLDFSGDRASERLFAGALERLAGLGVEPVEVDIAPLLEAGKLLYEGPWVSERYAAVGDFLAAHPEAGLPVTRGIILGGARPAAVDAFRASHRLAELARAAGAIWSAADAVVLPTAPTVFRVEEVEADPLCLNTILGRYTNHVNLLDLAAVAVPAGFRPDGLPFGVTLMAPAWADAPLLALADRLHGAAGVALGALGLAKPGDDAPPAPPVEPSEIALAVCGAHMEGLPLSPQLTSRGARLVSRTRTAAAYRLYALPGGPPERPGLVRVARGGAPVEVEVWAVPADRLGGFVALVPPPLAIGKVELADGARVSGFVCEAIGVEGAADITALGGWRGYLASRSGA